MIGFDPCKCGVASIPLPLLREAIARETVRAMRAYVVAVRDDKGEAWQTKDEAQGAAEGLWALARKLGHKPRDTGVPRGRRTSGGLSHLTCRKRSRLREVATQPRPRSADA